MANAGQTKRMTNSPAISPALNPFFGLLPPKLWNNAKDYFVYGTNFLPLTASATQTQDIAIESDSDFLITIVNGFVTEDDDATVPAHGFMLMELFDNGSGRRFQNTAQHWNNVVGVGTLPGFLPFPKLVPRASTISITLQNLIATDWHVRVSLIGFKIFGGMQ